jgi:type I restriction-modification system DNA methylase subunit
MQKRQPFAFTTIETAREQNVRILDQLRDGVKQAIITLGSAFLAYPTNHTLRDKLRHGRLLPQDYYRQVLRLVYRLIILFVIEDRGILQYFRADEQARKRYGDYYSIANLRGLSAQRIDMPHADLYRGLVLVMAHLNGDTGNSTQALSALDGFLFSPQAIPDLEGCDLTDRDLLDAVYSLAFTYDERTGIYHAVDYKTLGFVELGGVYESLLEMHSRLDIEAATFALKIDRENERKTSGSYYTPMSLINCLLDSALEPALEEACRQYNVEEALLGLKICDPACGCGHFLIAAAHRIARKLAAVRTGNEEPGPQTRRAALRDVVERCIYGVDINPMAVELCKVNLWMEAIEPGEPFSFPDAHILCGNSLLGATPSLLIQEELRRDRLIVSGETPPEMDDGHDQAVPAGLSLQRFDGKLLADAWCTAFVWKKTRGLACPTTAELLRAIEEGPDSLVARTREEIKRLAEQYQFFHWHLAFPDVFHLSAPGTLPQNEQAGWSGGFDVVLGNPPYLFGEKHDRRTNAMIKALFRLARGQFDASWLFIEQGLKLTGERGRLALVVPDALLTRDEAQKTRQLMLQQGLECVCYCGTAFKASVSTVIFVVAKGRETGEVLSKVLDGTIANTRYRCNKQRFFLDPKHRFLTHISDEEAAIFSRIESVCKPLGDYVKISRGEELGKKGVYADGPVPILVGDDISRYFLRRPSRFLQKIKKDALRYDAPKIVVAKTGSKCIAGLDHAGYVTMQSVYNLHIIVPDMTYESLLALLNSRFVDCFIFKTFTSYKRLFPQLNQSTIEAIPIPAFVGGVREEIDILVRSIQSLKIEMSGMNGGRGGQSVGKEVEHLSEKMDKMVYEAYGISAREIAIIESNVP